jgi:hypothetical protein
LDRHDADIAASFAIYILQARNMIPFGVFSAHREIQIAS